MTTTEKYFCKSIYLVIFILPVWTRHDLLSEKKKQAEVSVQRLQLCALLIRVLHRDPSLVLRVCLKTWIQNRLLYFVFLLLLLFFATKTQFCIMQAKKNEIEW